MSSPYISIRHILRFIHNLRKSSCACFRLFQYILCYTSLVAASTVWIVLSAFQYIICYTSLNHRRMLPLYYSCISIHHMLHFIPRKYKIPLLRDIYILPHKSAFFNTFYQPFLYFFHHNTLFLKIITYISKFSTYLIYLRLVKTKCILKKGEM